jgi:sulfide dehydrogenase cytochrome subunit
MMRVNTFLILMLLAAASPVLAADLDAVLAGCNDCHGPAGVSTDPDVPTIAGQSAYFLEESMIAYAKEDRACALSEYRHGDAGREPITMCQAAAALDEDMILELSNHYAELPFVRAEQDFDAAAAELGQKVHDRHCERCHSEGGSFRDDDAGILAGQHTEFLRDTIAEYREGTRPMSEKMSKAFEALNDDDFEALLQFYASPLSGGGG